MSFMVDVSEVMIPSLVSWMVSLMTSSTGCCVTCAVVCACLSCCSMAVLICSLVIVLFPFRILLSCCIVSFVMIVAPFCVWLLWVVGWVLTLVLVLDIVFSFREG